MSTPGELIRNKYFAMAVVLTIVSIAYWTFYAVNAYNSFIYTSDLGVYVYNMYYDIHFPSIMHGLQLVVFGQHIAPDQFMVLFVYFFFQSPLTLPIVQLLVLSLTGLLVFAVTKDLLKSDKLALVMCTAYLLNPGMHGMLIFDYHAEFFIVPFFIMVFYFYMKTNTKLLLVSLLLLLGVTETAPIVAIALGIGLYLYERAYKLDPDSSKARYRLAYTIILCSLGALLFYNAVYYALPPESVTITQGMPPIFAVAPFPLTPCCGGYTNIINGGTAAQRGGIGLSTAPLVAYALALVFLGFGLAVFFEPISALFFTAPWLAAVFIYRSIGFVLIYQQYFFLVVGGAFCATILGWKILQSGTPTVWKIISGNRAFDRAKLTRLVSYSSVALPILIALSSLLVLSIGLPNIQNQMFFQANSTLRSDYSQLDYAISMAPSVGNLSVEPFMMPHVANRQYMEELEDLYLVPDYVIVDFNNNVSAPADTTQAEGWFQKLESIVSSYGLGTYDTYLQNGTATVYKRIQAQT